MSYSYDLTSAVGQVRLLIPDHDPSSLVLFQDEDLSALLTLESQVVKRAAALALETVASDRVMVLQVIKTNGLFTDGAKVADALIKRAAALREQALFEEEQASGGFDTAEIVTGNFSYSERLWDSIMRQQDQG